MRGKIKIREIPGDCHPTSFSEILGRVKNGYHNYANWWFKPLSKSKQVRNYTATDGRRLERNFNFN